MPAASAPNAMAVKQTRFLAALLTCVLSPHSHAQTVKEKLFANPTNIEINLAYLQEQLAKRNFKGAAATLQRVLLLDPESKLAKVLYAEVQLRLGNLADARLILRELLGFICFIIYFFQRFTFVKPVRSWLKIIVKIFKFSC